MNLSQCQDLFDVHLVNYWLNVLIVVYALYAFYAHFKFYFGKKDLHLIIIKNCPILNFFMQKCFECTFFF